MTAQVIGSIHLHALMLWLKGATVFAHPKARVHTEPEVFYWRRWAPRLVESPNIHSEIPGVVQPAVLGNSSAMVLLTPQGRLIGMRAEPPDSVRTRDGGRPTWNAWFAAFGMDSTAYTPVALARAVPALCDTAKAWRGPSPWNAADTATIQMGASRGRLTHFTVVSAWGVPVTPVDVIRPVRKDPMELPLEMVFHVIPYVLAIVFAMRNLQLGRGDWRGATRIAVFVFFMNVGEAVFATRLSEVGIVGVLNDLFHGRAQGHALMHAMGMWFAYVALEPYVRRLWPRVLVSWTRLLTGRLRDPLVGRDLLVGITLGAALTALGLGTFALAPRLGLGEVPALANSGMFEALGSAGYTSVRLCYAGSICVLNVLQGLFILLLVRMGIRQNAIALLVGGLIFWIGNAAGIAPDLGWKLALLSALWGAIGIVIVVRVGLLATVVSAFTVLVLGGTAATLDFGSWYAGLVLLPMALLLGIACYGAVTALAGKSILGDPLEEAGKR